MKTTAQILQNADFTLSTSKIGLDNLESKQPNERNAGFRNLIVFGRAVTNVLQNLRSTEGEKFDEWYNPKVDEMKNNVLFKYFYKVRSEILKEGKLNVQAKITGHETTSFDKLRDEILSSTEKPPGAKRLFLDGEFGGFGWEIESSDGTISDYFVGMPNSVAGFNFSSYFPEAPEEIRHLELNNMAQEYFNYLSNLVNEAKQVFGTK